MLKCVRGKHTAFIGLEWSMYMNYFILWTVFEFLCSAVAFAFLIYYVISGKYNSQAKSNRQIENYVVTTSESGNYYYDFDKGESGELEVRNIIRKIDGHKKILSNLYIPIPDGRTTEIDVLMIHESGIYLFESKNYSGWIFGNEKQQEWVQSFSNGRKSKKIHFPNPIIQNHVHMKWLQNFLRDNSFPFYSFIVFGNGCELKNVTITSGNHAVVEQYQLFDCVNRTALAHQGCLQPEKIDELYEKLMPLTQKSLAEKEKHIENIREKYYFSFDEIENFDKKELKCPFCGSKLVMRKAASGSHKGRHFIGCSNYPKCRYIQNIVEMDSQ